MDVWDNVTTWVVLLVFLCLCIIWLKWRHAYPRCISCRKRIRRAFAYCPWCSMQQFHAQRVQQVKYHRAPKRASRDVFVAQEAATMPHKRPRTVVLPENPREIKYQAHHQRRQRREAGTVLVPDPSVRPHEPVISICGACGAALDSEDQKCLFCNSKTIIRQSR